MAATRFNIAIPDSDLEVLRQKLVLARLPDELEGAGWDYGVPLADIRRLVDHWKDGYDWRKAEAMLNADLPQFTRDIEVEGHGTLNVHYVHKRSDVDGAIPLLFVHGWPGSFIEVRKILPLLTAPESADSPAFHVVCLGLPGYGFSEAPRKKGFGPIQYAEAGQLVGHRLMLALGYNEYVTQGGDWGWRITRAIVAKYGPNHAKAWHTNMPIGSPPTLFRNPFLYITHMIKPYTASEREGLRMTREIDETGRAYHDVHDTKPQTIGYSLADSPVSLLAWVYEKLVAWTDEYAWTDDEVLTWISIYWFSRAGPAASVRIYYENRVSQTEQSKLPVTVPTGFAYFPREIYRFPRLWKLSLGKVVQEVEHEKGGHFAAYEVPELLVSDLRKMFGKGGPAYGVVKTSKGYPETL
ncbi:Alpha/Beta hydrolase protein [Vararia minispora EC-137]|uniref:Alpha/Beta hydrolase protein n=1 Tax=Vararia minispora EC-137 TaxID=1314806 RepID=A0ACB8Q851_9AGAM|nr:Alpha/Beta hydrolase protein [Vararia minispora EC-137]